MSKSYYDESDVKTYKAGERRNKPDYYLIRGDTAYMLSLVMVLIASAFVCMAAAMLASAG